MDAKYRFLSIAVIGLVSSLVLMGCSQRVHYSTGPSVDSQPATSSKPFDALENAVVESSLESVKDHDHDAVEMLGASQQREETEATSSYPGSSESSEAGSGSGESLEEPDIVPRPSMSEDFRASFVHGAKGAAYQKYIVLHDTEGSSDPWSVIDWWDSSGNLVAAHFVVGKDGTIVQCVPLDSIAHHAGFGDAGHNELYGVEDESRDDRLGTVPIGDWAPDYGMNSYSIGIEMVHIGGEGYYPEEQLEAVDSLIAYIDSYYGFESQIIDHKAWRSGNSDTSSEFATYLANYQDHRAHS